MLKVKRSEFVKAPKTLIQKEFKDLCKEIKQEVKIPEPVAEMHEMKKSITLIRAK